MLESKVDALTEAMDGAVRIALLESEVDELRRRDAERTGDDRDMGLRTAFLQYQAA